MALTTRCLDCGTRTRGSRCTTCARRRVHARNHAPAQRARLSISSAQRHRVYSRDGYRCIDCYATHDLTLDHVVALAFEVKRNYRDDELATRCRSCNGAKGAAPARFF